MKQILRLLAVVYTLSVVCQAVAEEVRPYVAVVAADDTPVHSGPGRNYYVTGRLRRGAEVEVYRHDNDGWLAIRPPEGSFSLVGVRYLRAESPTLATVKDDQVGARIGSLESPDRDVVQVRLARGEQVELLEPKPVATADSSQAWYMIAPPAGEFRWVHESRLAAGARALPEANPPRHPPAEPRTRAVAQEDQEAENVIYLDDPEEEVAAPHARGTRLATYEMQPDERQRRDSNATGESDGWTGVDRPRTSHIRAESPTPRTASTRAIGRPERETAPANEAPPARMSRGGNLRAELDAIELALSQMVAQDSSQWDFTEINRRAEKLLDQSATAVERGRSRLLLRKIARFEDIAEGYASVRASGMQSARPIAPIEPLPPLDETESVAETRRPPRPLRSSSNGIEVPGSVGVGRLTQVVSKRPGAPTFALVDENRQVRYFVTPSAGINLRSYVGKQVSVSGVTSYNSAFRKQELTAERVDVLSDSILRR